MPNAVDRDDFDSYLYAITHDLKSFARAMKVIPDWIAEDLSENNLPLPRAVSEHLVMLQSYADGMDRMLDGLTELSRISGTDTRIEDVDLRELVNEIWRRFEDTGFSLDMSRIGCSVRTVRHALHGVITELISNAVLHHDQEVGRVVVQAEKTDAGVLLSIHDDGPGISADLSERVFEPLHTLRPKDQTGLAGLGLTRARKFAGIMGGTVSLRCHDTERGCIFDVHLRSQN